MHDDVDKEIEGCEEASDSEGGFAVLEDGAHEEGDERDGHNGGDDV